MVSERGCSHDVDVHGQNSSIHPAPRPYMKAHLRHLRLFQVVRVVGQVVLRLAAEVASFDDATVANGRLQHVRGTMQG